MSTLFGGIGMEMPRMENQSRSGLNATEFTHH